MSKLALIGFFRGGGPPLWLLCPPPPCAVDPPEDWVRLPADDRDLRARVATLSSRADVDLAQPELDEDGLLRYRGRWTALSPVERLLASALGERFGAVVSREGLAR